MFSNSCPSVSALPTPPVLVVAFNRPDLTAQVFSAIRWARPKRFYFAVDGAHPGHTGERERVLAVRALKDSVDWPCETRTLFRSKNLGCKVAVSQAITWFFDQVESGIILEDDCVPDPSFFPFTAELLERYKDDRRVALISGDNFQFGKERTRDSYYFSRYNHIWGWASWRRAWHLYDHRMSDWPALRARGWLSEFFQDPAAARYWTKIFDETHAERNSSWAYRWTFACWSNALLTALPSVNLVSNIGFGAGATHTLFRGRLADLPAEPMGFPLRHPPEIERNVDADEFTQATMFRNLPLWRRLGGRAVRALRRATNRLRYR